MLGLPIQRHPRARGESVTTQEMVGTENPTTISYALYSLFFFAVHQKEKIVLLFVGGRR
jgi:hypothetical protein